MMDKNETSPTIINEKNTVDDDNALVKSKKRTKRAPRQPTDSSAIIENRIIPMSSSKKTTDVKHDQPDALETSVHSVKSVKSNSSDVDQTNKFNHCEVTSVVDHDDDDDDDENQIDRRVVSQTFSQTMTDRDNTMVSSFTTGGDNDVIEIHQFSSADIDDYLDIYFETLDNRLRRYIGENEELQLFRAAMKKRINSNPNASEYQNVLLGKINGEVLAAVTMLFPKEKPTIPQTSDTQPRNSCLTPVHRWMVRKANYVPASIEECYIEMIGVKTAYRNHGIGSAMLECVEHFARQANAHMLTVHINGQQLQSFFHRFGFNIDNTDSSPFWKWLVERQTITKLSKILTSEDEHYDQRASSYLNESMVESVHE